MFSRKTACGISWRYGGHRVAAVHLSLIHIFPLPSGWQQYVPEIAFPWRVTIGTLVTFTVGDVYKRQRLLRFHFPGGLDIGEQGDVNEADVVTALSLIHISTPSCCAFIPL